MLDDVDRFANLFENTDFSSKDEQTVKEEMREVDKLYEKERVK